MFRSRAIKGLGKMSTRAMKKKQSQKSMITDTDLIVVGIITYQRPEGLQRLLESLRQLSFTNEQPPTWQVVVVDNDPAAPARTLVAQIGEAFPVPIRYGVEPIQGIASARNKVVTLAPPCDFIAFIDDDEVADPHWLDQLLAVQQETQADIVTGPVIPLYEAVPPRWIVRGGFFDRRRLPTGSSVHFAASNNILVKSEWLRTLPGPFDMRFNLTGGSDSHFSRRVIQHGGKVIWADEAIVKEYNPPNRLMVSWILQRAFRIAFTTTLIEKDLYSFYIVFMRFLKACYNFFLGFVLFIPFVVYYGYPGIIKSLQKMARSAGAIYALFGGHYEEYSRNTVESE
jgi:succinoglycan biosynthesis protein ExoM